jgi:hypothetical protein
MAATVPGLVAHNLSREGGMPMSTPNLKPAKPVDTVAYEPVMLAMSKARAMAWVLGELPHSHDRNDLVCAINRSPRPEDTRDWLQNVVAAALTSALDDVESEYRRLRTEKAVA